MTVKELKAILNTLGIVTEYHKTPEINRSPPCGILYRNGKENIYADDMVYSSFEHYVLDIYTRHRDTALEEQIETLFAQNGIVYEFFEDYDEDERLNIASYDFYI